MNTIPYRPEVDGLRAAAILPVLAFHLGLSWLPGGFLGVDVFFVISGYLITSLIVTNLEAGTFTLKGFWARRIRRIMPALMVMIAVTLLLGVWLLFGKMLSSFGKDGFAASLSWANMAMLGKEGDYWGPDATASPFLHTWSLSLEEQFYLLFPLLLVALFKLKWPIGRVLVSLFGLSLVLCAAVGLKSTSAAFYLLPTRAWELLAGALVAIYGGRWASLVSRSWKAVLVAAGFVALVLPYFIELGRLASFGLSAVSVMGTVLILAFASRLDPVSAVLSARPVVWVGKISYSLYLWHWPVILMTGMTSRLAGWALPWWAVLGAATALALLSYYGVEKPARKSRWGVPVALGLLVVAVLASCLAWRVEFPGYDVAAYHAPTNWRGKYDIKPDSPQGGTLGGTRQAGERADIVLVGDSHGTVWTKVLDEIGVELHRPVAFYTMAGNNPYFEIPLNHPVTGNKSFTPRQYAAYAADLLASIHVWKPRVVVLAGKWSERKGTDFRNVEGLIRYCRGEGSAVVVLDQPPVSVIEGRDPGQFLAFRGLVPTSDDRFLETKDQNKVARGNARIRDVAKRTGAVVLSVYTHFAVGDRTAVLHGRDILYYNDNHLSYEGSLRVKDDLKQMLSQLLE